MLEIRKNLMSDSLLNNHGFRLMFESDKFVYQIVECMSENGI